MFEDFKGCCWKWADVFHLKVWFDVRVRQWKTVWSFSIVIFSLKGFYSWVNFEIVDFRSWFWGFCSDISFSWFQFKIAKNIFERGCDRRWHWVEEWHFQSRWWYAWFVLRFWCRETWFWSTDDWRADCWWADWALFLKINWLNYETTIESNIKVKTYPNGSRSGCMCVWYFFQHFYFWNIFFL